MSRSELGVLVAVGPDGVQDGVLDLAAAEARRLDTGVELLHVVHSLVVVPTAEERVQDIDQSLTAVGRGVLSDAADRLRSRMEIDLPVSTQLLTGLVAATIESRAAGADVVILERRDVGTVGRMLTMSISTRVATHTDRPVVIVPRSWTPPADPRLPVTVGVDTAFDAVGQVEAAAAYARDTGRPLVVLHAVWLAEPYQDLVLRDYRREEWVQDATTQVEVGLAKLPDADALDLRTQVCWERPVNALVAASGESSLLVLSRRADGRHLGGITRSVLQHARCPVMVADRS